MAIAWTRARVVIVMNPRSGGDKAARHNLKQRAEGMGGQVWKTSMQHSGGRGVAREERRGGGGAGAGGRRR